MGYLRNKLSYIAKNNFAKTYQFLYQLRENWRIKRQEIFKYKYNKERYPGLFLQNDYEPFPGIESKVDRVIYCFWTGDNEMSENRKRGYQSLIDNSGVEVKLITPKNLHEYILPEHPLHPAYDYLSLVHKSDYLRCYFMHFHGGGYQDIKFNENSWVESFNKIDKYSDKWVLGYTELHGRGMGRGQGIIDKDLYYYYRHCVGTGGFICKSNTPFTTQWYLELLRRMDYYEKALKANPGDIKGRNEGYPIKLLHILSQIWALLCLKYRHHIIHDNNVLPILINYQ
ncbi:glycosyltransferase family 32 protein [Vaginella massiliensis]|uniref:capsular polysaccharide synthesis protein n=1 Tax=Vaginella massiliensis TaxID=1816680 RepID=UPI000838D452|nr:capsular polysaccharide synthesis protein [Vaginella massiliensis]